MTIDRTGQRIDNYQLLQKLGDGSFGQVYLAEDLRRKTKVAIKVLDPFTTQKERAQFFDEVRSLVRLRHPNIVSVIDFGIDKGNNLPPIMSTERKVPGQAAPHLGYRHEMLEINLSIWERNGPCPREAAQCSLVESSTLTCHERAPSRKTPRRWFCHAW